jgi:two-component system chemotaxis response regulator CheB
MVSSLTDAGAAATLRAFELGAVDAILKPREGDTANLGQKVRDAVRAAVHARPRPGGAAPASPAAPERPKTHRIEDPKAQGSARVKKVGTSSGIMLAPDKVATRLVAIGSSTGGTEALKEILKALPRVFPPVVIVQHMPDGFTGHFAKSLAALCDLEVLEAPMADVALLPGRVVLAKGGLHLLVAAEGEKVVAQVRDGPAVRNHKPSVDVLFTSVAKALGSRALGVILTGMGDDGARGMLKMREAGSHTFAQDAASCVVYGMPKRAVELGGVEKTVELHEIGNELVKALAR